MDGKPGYVLFDSEPLRSDPLRGLGEIKRVNGKAVCYGATIEFDGMIDGEVTITVRCGFKNAQAICEAIVRLLTPEK